MATEPQIYAIGNLPNRHNAPKIENSTLAHFRHFSSLFTNLPSTSVENPLQINPFYAKQTQFPKKSNEHNYLFTKGL